MDPFFAGKLPELDKCPNLSMEERMEIVDELHQCMKRADLRDLWSRQDLQEFICREIGERRKHTSLSKKKMMELLIGIMSKKISEGRIEDRVQRPPLPPPPPPPPPPPVTQIAPKRRRKVGRPSRLSTRLSMGGSGDGLHAIRVCNNSACRAALSLKDAFCKRCSCCLCRNFDENKDPSLWLLCGSEAPSQADMCGMSYHLECLLKQERAAGFENNGQWIRLDGRYRCVYCGRENDLLSCWRKQLMIAKDARRVGDLGQRIYLSHQILCSSEKYKALHQIVVAVRTNLEAEVGPLNNLPLNMSRGLVSRLLVGLEVQKMCATAVESLDSLRSSLAGLPFESKFHEASWMASNIIRFEDVYPTSLTVVLGSDGLASSSQELLIYTLWHRKAHGGHYPTEPTHTLCGSQGRMLVSELSPATEYMFRAIAYSSMRLLGIWEVVGVTSANGPEHVGSPRRNINNPPIRPSSVRDDSDRATAFQDLNQLPDCGFGYARKPVIDLEKAADEFSGEAVYVQKECEDIEEVALAGQRDIMSSTEREKAGELLKLEKPSSFTIGNEGSVVPFVQSESTPPVKLSWLEASRGGSGKSGEMEQGRVGLNVVPMRPDKEVTPGGSSKAGDAGQQESLEGDYEYCVKAVRWLEREGHMEASFRTKFLTWFSLRAEIHERRIVKVFVDTLADDPGGLAAQLVDTFSDCVCRKSPPLEPKGLCLKLETTIH